MSETPRRFALVVLDLIQTCRARCGAGFGKYPVGMRDAILAVLPFVPENDSVSGVIKAQWADLEERLSR